MRVEWNIENVRLTGKKCILLYKCLRKCLRIMQIYPSELLNFWNVVKAIDKIADHHKLKELRGTETEKKTVRPFEFYLKRSSPFPFISVSERLFRWIRK